jgi:hypothetical protein
VAGDTVTGRIEHTNDASRAAGVDRFIVAVTVTVRGDKIAHSKRSFDTSDAQTARFVAFMQAQAAPGPQPTGLPRTAGAGAPLPITLGVGAFLLGMGLAIRGSGRPI